MSSILPPHIEINRGELSIINENNEELDSPISVEISEEQRQEAFNRSNSLNNMARGPASEEEEEGEAGSSSRNLVSHSSSTRLLQQQSSFPANSPASSSSKETLNNNSPQQQHSAGPPASPQLAHHPVPQRTLNRHRRVENSTSFSSTNYSPNGTLNHSTLHLRGENSISSVDLSIIPGLVKSSPTGASITKSLSSNPSKSSSLLNGGNANGGGGDGSINNVLAGSLHGKESKTFYGLETYSTDGGDSDKDSSDDDEEENWIDPSIHSNSSQKRNADKYEPKGGFGQAGGENSIIPEVAATIPITDKVHYKALTFRVLFISFFISVFTACCSQFFFFRYNHVSLDSIAHIILSYPMGILLSKLPKSWTWLNPGHFNHKEHTLIVLICSTAISYPYQNVILLMQRLYLGRVQDPTNPSEGLNIGYPSALILLIASQLLGFGLGGLLNKVLVEPASMWWPSNLVLGNLIHSFHGTVTKRITNLRLKMFQYIVLFGFLYQTLPQIFMPLLQSVSILCLIFGGASASGIVSDPFGFGAPPLMDGRSWMGQFGSGSSGGGLFAVTFDYSAISQFAPMITPLWSTLNVIFANFALAWVITPIFVYYDIWNSKTFPAYGGSGYAEDGTIYNRSAILDPVTLQVDPNTVVPLFRLSTNRLLIYACSFAAISSLLVQFCLYYLPTVINVVKGRKEEKKDVHAKMMERYPSVPGLYYIILTALMMTACIAVIQMNYTAFQLDWWGVPLALFISAIFSLPVGIVLAISNQTIGLNVLSQLIMGYMKPGSLLANATFKVFGTNTLDQALFFAGSMKLAYYMKIPPQDVFIGLVYGTVVSSISSYATFDYLINNVPIIWEAAHGERVGSQAVWFTQLPEVILTAGELWGIVSPQRAFGAGSAYNGIYFFFLGGALVTFLFFLLHRWFPKVGFNYVNWPIIFESVGILSVAGANGLLSTFVVAFVSQYIVRKYHRRWYDRYNYTMAAALDFVVLLGPILLFCLFDSGLIAYSFPPLYALNPNTTTFGPDYCGSF